MIPRDYPGLARNYLTSAWLFFFVPMFCPEFAPVCPGFASILFLIFRYEVSF